jgi:hypothetical protein
MRFPARLPIREPQRTPLALGGRRGWLRFDWSIVAKGALPPRMTYARSGTAYDFTFASYGANTPPISANGFLGEGSETNLALQSRAFATTPWAGFGTSVPTVTADQYVAPDGSTTADQITFNGQNAGQIQGISTTNGTTYLVAAWLKRVSGNTALHWRTSNSASGNDQAFTLSETDFTFKSVAVLGRSGGGTVSFGLEDRNASGFGSIGAWGFRVVAGGRYSSPLLTTTTSFTRQAFTCIDSAIVPQAGGWPYRIKGRTPPVASGTQVFHRYDDNSSANFAQLVYTGGNLVVQITTGSATVAELDLGAVAVDTEFTVAIRLEGDNFAASLDWATVVAPPTTGAVPTITHERWNHGLSGNESWGHLIEVPAFGDKHRKQLDNAGVQELALPL